MDVHVFVISLCCLRDRGRACSLFSLIKKDRIMPEGRTNNTLGYKMVNLRLDEDI